MKSIEGFSRYSISEAGEVIDSKRGVEVVKVINGGFYCVNLFNDSGKRSLQKVHRLLAEAFGLASPNLGTFKVSPKDGNKLNIDLSNLKVTYDKVGGRGFGHRAYQKSSKESQALGSWAGMLGRTSANNRKLFPSYVGVSVDEEWYDFKRFLDWHKIERFIWNYNGFNNLEVDKDILKRGNKVYSPKYCSLVTREINQLFKPNQKASRDRVESCLREFAMCINKDVFKALHSLYK